MQDRCVAIDQYTKLLNEEYKIQSEQVLPRSCALSNSHKRITARLNCTVYNRVSALTVNDDID